MNQERDDSFDEYFARVCMALNIPVTRDLMRPMVRTFFDNKFTIQYVVAFIQYCLDSADGPCSHMDIDADSMVCAGCEKYLGPLM